MEIVARLSSDEFEHREEIEVNFLGKLVRELADKEFVSVEQKRDFVEEVTNDFFGINNMVSGAPTLTVTVQHNSIVVE